MPIYIYQCLNEGCEHSFEEYKSYNSKKKVKCPECESRNIKKVIGVSTVVYKGEGFTKKVLESG